MNRPVFPDFKALRGAHRDIEHEPGKRLGIDGLPGIEKGWENGLEPMIKPVSDIFASSLLWSLPHQERRPVTVQGLKRVLL